jgi:hypothetical protein
MRRFIIGPPVPDRPGAWGWAASVISPARRMMPAQTSRPRPSGPPCTCLPRQSTLAPTAASESPRATEAVAPRASSTQVGHRQRVAEQVFEDPSGAGGRPGCPEAPVMAARRADRARLGSSSGVVRCVRSVGRGRARIGGYGRRWSEGPASSHSLCSACRVVARGLRARPTRRGRRPGR